MAITAAMVKEVREMSRKNRSRRYRYAEGYR